MNYREILPTPTLATFIRCFWSLDYQRHEGVSEPEPVLPDGCPEIVFNLSDKFIRITEREEIQPRTLLAGQMTRRILIRPAGHVSLFGVRFTPAGASQVLNVPVCDVTDEIVELSVVAGPVGLEIEEKINAAGSFEARAALFERFILRRLSESDEIDRVALTASDIIVRARGRLPVSSLIDKLGVSERQLERRFRRSIGLSPKMFSRIIRFQSAVRAFQNGTCPNLLDTALAFGYYDQSHLIRDFKEFSGSAPLAYFQNSHNISDIFTRA